METIQTIASAIKDIKYQVLLLVVGFILIIASSPIFAEL